MFYHFEELKVTLVAPKSRKKMILMSQIHLNFNKNHFLRLLGATKVTLSSSKWQNMIFGVWKDIWQKKL